MNTMDLIKIAKVCDAIHDELKVVAKEARDKLELSRMNTINADLALADDIRINGPAIDLETMTVYATDKTTGRFAAFKVRLLP